MNSMSFIFDIVLTKLEMPKLNIANSRKLTAKIKFCNKEINLTNSSINVSDFRPGSAVELQTSLAKLRQKLKGSTMRIFLQYDYLLVGKAEIQFSQCFIDNIEQDMTNISHSQISNIVYGSQIVGSIEVLYRLSVKGKNDSMSKIGTCRRDLESNIQKNDILFLLGNSQECPSQWQPEPSEGNDRFQLDIERYKELNCRWHDDSRVFTNNNYGNSAVTPLKEFLQECTDVIDTINALPSFQKAKKHRSGSDSRAEGLLPSPAAQGRSYTPCVTTSDWSKPQSWNQPTTNYVSPTINPTRFCANCLYDLSWLPKFATCPKCYVKTEPTFEEPVQNAEPTFEQILNDYLGKQRPRRQEDKRCGETAGKQGTRCRCTSEGKRVCAYCRIRKMCSDIYKPNEDRKAELQPDNLEINLEEVDSRPHLTRVFSDLRDLYRFKTRKEFPVIHTKYLQKKLNLNRNMGDAQPRTDHSTAKRSFQAKPMKKQPKVGHKSCASRQLPVPRRHGWAWASSYEARKHGWRPGAILKPIGKLMNFFLYHLPGQNAEDVCQQELESNQEPDSAPPILHVRKKGGKSIITLHPLGCSEQAMPVVFRVVKSDFAMVLSSLKKSLKARGFRKCTCHKTIKLCDCRPYREKKRLEYALSEECKYRGMESCVNDLVLTDTSDSETEFDIDTTSMKAKTQPWTAQKPRTCNIGTQFNGEPNLNLPIKQSPCWRAFDCAAGDRNTGTAFGKPGEAVFEDGIFGYGGGGPHGAAPLPAKKAINKSIWGGKRSRGPMRNATPLSGCHPPSAEVNALKKQYTASHQPKRQRARRVVNYYR